MYQHFLIIRDLFDFNRKIKYDLHFMYNGFRNIGKRFFGQKKLITIKLNSYERNFGKTPVRFHNKLRYFKKFREVNGKTINYIYIY